MLDDPKRPWKKAAFHLFPRSVKGEGQFMGRAVRTDRYRLVEWTTPGKPQLTRLELYDYEKDSDETVNLASHQEQAEIMKMLKDLLHQGWRAARPE
ncbi:MAG: DUF4976 domain-containing protein [Desulfobacterales bacterium]|nr:DUF4976 domain-containing protein [Desulfobacterales bacterium]